MYHPTQKNRDQVRLKNIAGKGSLVSFSHKSCMDDVKISHDIVLLKTWPGS